MDKQIAKPIQIIKPANDQKLYQYIKMSNEIECILCEDNTLKKSTFSISVQNGFINDPPGHLGLAHFIEHLLFLGSGKYPKEDIFDNYLSINGGSTNATTDLATTNYYFDINTEALEGGLDIMSQFFISPLFGKDFVDKELKALNSEYHEACENEESRLEHVIITNANPLSKFRIFMGNKETLANARDDTIKHYNEAYSSNLMKIAMQSNLSLDKQADILIKTFGQIKNKGIIKTPIVDPKPFEHPYCQRIFRIVPYKKIKKVVINWYTQSLLKEKSQSGEYLAELLGHEGPNSLLSYLKKEGLATSLSCELEHFGEAQSSIKVEIKVTDKGLDGYMDVLDGVYMFINKIKQEGVQQYFAEEISQIAKLDFEYQSSENVEDRVVEQSEMLHFAPPEEILTAQYPIQKLNISIIQDLLLKLRPECSDIFIVGKKFAKEANLTDKLFPIKYSMDEIPDYLVKKWNKILPTTEKLSHPPKNIYIPNSVAVLPKCADDPSPQLILRNEFAECYYRDECNFSTPVTKMSIRFITNDCEVSSSPEGIAFLFLWQRFMQDYINEDTYMAHLVGNSFKFEGSYCDFKFPPILQVSIKGFSSSISSMVTDLFRKVIACQIQTQENMFTNVYNSLKTELQNVPFKSPLSQAYILLNCITQSSQFQIEDVASALLQINFQKFIALSQNWLRSARTRWLVIGSIPKEDLINTITQFISIVHYSPLPMADLPIKYTPKLAESRQYCFKKILASKDEHTSALIQYIQSSVDYSTAYMFVACQIFQNDYFVELRTKKQVGYSVGCHLYDTNGILNYCFEIRSADYNPEELIGYNVWFFDYMIEKINGLTEECFNKFKDSALLQFIEKDTNFKSQFERYFKMFSLCNYEFDLLMSIAAEIPKLDLCKFKEYVKDLLGPKSRQLCIEVMNEETATINEKEVSKTLELNKKHGWERVDLQYYRMLCLLCESHSDLLLYRYLSANYLYDAHVVKGSKKNSKPKAN